MPVYYEDYRPVNVFCNNVKVAGYTEKEYSGKEIHLDGTYKDKLNLTVYGEHSQNINSGANPNLLDPSKATLGTPVENGVTGVTAWGSAMFNNAWVLSTLKPSTTYYAKAILRVTARPDGYTVRQSPLKALTLFSLGDKSLYPTTNIISTYEIPEIGQDFAISTTFTTPDALHDNNASYRVIAYSERWTSDVDTSSAHGTVDFLDLIISEVDVPFSPYGATVSSPSLQCPSDIISVNDCSVGIGRYNNHLGVGLYGNEEYYDSVTIEGGKYKITRWWNELSFDGSEEWSLSSDSKYFALRLQYPTFSDDALKLGMCSHYPFEYVGSINGLLANGYMLYTGRALTDLFAKDVEAWKAHLAEESAKGNPVIAVYLMGSPIVEYLDGRPTPGTYMPVIGTMSQDGTPTAEAPISIEHVDDVELPFVDDLITINSKLYGNGTFVDTFENEVDTTRTSKNLLPYPYAFGNIREGDGVSVIAQVDGGISVSGTSTAYIAVNLYRGNLPTTGKMTYSLQGEFYGMVGVIMIYENSTTLDTLTLNAQNGFKYTVDFKDYPTATSVMIRVRVIATGSEVGGIIYPMLNDGEIALSYEKYGETVGAITSQLTKYWAEVTFDGTEKWMNNSSGEVARYCPSLSNYDKSVAGLCTHLPVASDPAKQGVYFGVSVNFIFDTSWTLDDWKAYLASQYEAGTPVKLLYKLLEPEVIMGDPIPLETTPEHLDIVSNATVSALIKVSSEVSEDDTVAEEI